MKKIVVIFGASGNIGAYSALQLKKDGYEVIAVGSRKTDNGFFNDYDILYYSVDICKSESFKCLPKQNVFATVHFAGTLPSRYEYDPGLLIGTITLGTLNVLEYTRTSGAKKIIFAQTPFDLYYLHNTAKIITADAQRSFPKTGDHSVYTIAKNSAVDLLEHYYYTYKIKRFILRFFTIYQYHPNPFHYADGIKKKMPYRIIIDKAIRGETIEVWGDPQRFKEIVYVKDLTQVVSKSLSSNCDGGIFNVGGQKPVTLEEQIQGIIEIFSPKDKPSTIIYCPEKPDALLASLDNSKTINELGYHPMYTYIDGLRDLYHEMKTEPFSKLWGRKEDYE